MKKLDNKIVKAELKIYDKCPDEKKELINSYWDYHPDYEFKLLPSQVYMKFRITLKELHNTIETFSNMSLYLNCGYCDTVERNTYTSQTGFRHKVSLLRKLKNKKYKCEKCQAIEEKKDENQKLLESKEREAKQHKELMKKVKLLNQAVDEKKWENLSEFENVVLKNAIVLSNIAELKEYYFNQGIQPYKMLFSALRILEAENLILLEYDAWDKTKIEKYHIYGRLRDEYVYQPRVRNFDVENLSQQNSKQTNKIELTLSASLNQFHPDCPPLSTKFNPKEDIILKSGTEYVCNLYNQPNGEVSIKINPIENIKEIPIQISLDSLPPELRKQVEDFLRSSSDN